MPILFQLGPTKGEIWITEQDMEVWERRRGINLSPWEAETLVKMSQSYLAETHAARSFAALCPWPEGQRMWSIVCAEKHKKQKAEDAKKEERDGSSKRRRNPPPG